MAYYGGGTLTGSSDDRGAPSLMHALRGAAFSHAVLVGVCLIMSFPVRSGPLPPPQWTIVSSLAVNVCVNMPFCPVPHRKEPRQPSCPSYSCNLVRSLAAKVFVAMPFCSAPHRKEPRHGRQLTLGATTAIQTLQKSLCFVPRRKEPRHGKRLTLATTAATPQGPLLVYCVHLEVRAVGTWCTALTHRQHAGARCCQSTGHNQVQLTSYHDLTVSCARLKARCWCTECACATKI